MINPPYCLIDPEGEGIYFHQDYNAGLMEAARLFFNDAKKYREINTKITYWKKSEDCDELIPADIGKYPRGWKLNFPKKWRAEMYIYYTPKQGSM